MTRNTHANLSEHSRFGQRVARRYSDQLLLIQDNIPTKHHMQQVYQALQQQGHDASAALRILRQLVLHQLLAADCDRNVDLQDITLAMTELAEFALETAFLQAQHLLHPSHGVPWTAENRPAQLCIIGMGKLGARELNVSSDIDLIYVYDHDGETTGNDTGRGKISNQEYFAKLARTLYTLIGDTTEHGFVFRVDLALRPNGNSGPATLSLSALEEYFQVQGREWERFAWLKSRVIAPVSVHDSDLVKGLREIVVPFVFRRYLDYGVFDALRVLHRQIREHAARRSAGRPERSNDVKLSRGGIREIEFTVQLLQVVRGGQYPELRTRPTLSALQRLCKAGLMPQENADSLAQAYVFLRQVEHRIQYLDDQQTHILPTDDGDLLWIAQTMGFNSSPEFLSALNTHREYVAQEFDALLGGAHKECKNCPGSDKTQDASDFDSLLEQLSGDLKTRVAAWRHHPRVLALREESRQRLGRLILRTSDWLKRGETQETATLRLLDWIEPLLRRESYLAMLLERPTVHQRLLHMLGAARWPARYLLKHPGVIDELADNRMFEERFDATAFAQELETRRHALQGGTQDDEETLLLMLRRAHHAEVFRTLARDVEGRLTVEQVADDLSALADTILRITTTWCWSKLKNRHCETPHFAILAYGKLGGKELGYGSDLDIVFVYDDEDDRAAEVYAALVRKLINWLTVNTAEGDLYEIDTALRPNGNSGMLVTSFRAFENYQLGRGSNTAWTWEHQAMTRARCVLGSPELQQRFDAVREAVIASHRDHPALHDEIVAMRQKVSASRPVKGELFDVKHSPGGMVDVEFAVQQLVLAHSAVHPELRPNVGNIALLQRAQVVGLLPATVGDDAARAYRVLRQIQHRARLNEEPTQVAPASIVQERDAVLALWQAVFGASLPAPR
jgi:[glutamine synthetase] adenylyltransferase / [glutamine synthetase]-adenylyl-L-tyrosine phosphorylase